MTEMMILSDEEIQAPLPPVVTHVLGADVVVGDADGVKGFAHLRFDVLDTYFRPVIFGLGFPVKLLFEIFLDADYKMYLVRNNLYLGGAGNLDIAEFLIIGDTVLGSHHAAGENGSGSSRDNKGNSFHTSDVL